MFHALLLFLMRHPCIFGVVVEVVQCLIELFDSMDLDGDRSLEFEEFLSTIVHLGEDDDDCVCVCVCVYVCVCVCVCVHVACVWACGMCM